MAPIEKEKEMAEQKPQDRLLGLLGDRFFEASLDSSSGASSGLSPQEFKPGWDIEATPQTDSVRMVGILFAPKGSPLTREQIEPRLREWHYRSGDHIDIFCAGYARAWGGSADVALQFDEVEYNNFRKWLADQTTWEYGGDVDLLLLNALCGKDQQPYLDFTSVVACRLDTMINDKAIESVGQFFETVFRFAEKGTGDDPTWGLSEEFGIAEGRNLFVELVLLLLPEKVRESFKKAKHFAVKDVSKGN